MRVADEYHGERRPIPPCVTATSNSILMVIPGMIMYQLAKLVNKLMAKVSVSDTYAMMQIIRCEGGQSLNKATRS